MKHLLFNLTMYYTTSNYWMSLSSNKWTFSIGKDYLYVGPIRLIKVS